jgi:hypothetical protein
MWHYVHLRKYLRDKRPTELTGQEQFLHIMLESRDIALFPIGRALCLEERLALEGADGPRRRGAQ